MDIGTTVTAWIVAIKITKYGLLITGISGLLYLFSRHERSRFIYMLIMGLGMVFSVFADGKGCGTIA